MTPESHLVYHCLCGWCGPMLPPQALQCPRCGARLEAFSVMVG
jgi:ribosomal protein L40E